ncbi:MAG: hypothetical protein ACMXYF_05175 [Candidatus Woesearchaeota archaeon]
MKYTPLGIKVIAIFSVISGIIAIITSLAWLLPLGEVETLVNQLDRVFGVVSGVVLGAISSAGIIWGAFHIVLGWYLWKKQLWARYIVASLNAVAFLLILFGGIMTLSWQAFLGAIITGAIAYYLFFSKQARRAFA